MPKAIIAIIIVVVIAGTGYWIYQSNSTPQGLTEKEIELIQGKISVKQSGGTGMLIRECGDKNYIIDKADYIIEGTVEKVESGLDKVDSSQEEGKASIFTYTDLSIEKYIKGAPFAENKLQIVTPGGTIGETTLLVEDQPIFHEGKKVRIYFQENNGEFSIICAQFGVEEI